MNTFIYSILFVSALFGAIQTLAEMPEDQKLESCFKTYLDEHFRLRPVEATKLGDHRFDAQLEDVSLQARESWLAHSRRTLRELPRQVNYSRLSRPGQIDFEILKHQLETQIWLTKNTKPFEEDPRAYNDYINDSVYMLLTQSTLPRETNVANCIARMAQIPRVILTAKQTLKHPPKPI